MEYPNVKNTDGFTRDVIQRLLTLNYWRWFVLRGRRWRETPEVEEVKIVGIANPKIFPLPLRLCHNAEWSLRDASQASWQSRVFGYLGDCFSRCCSFAMTLRHSLADRHPVKWIPCRASLARNDRKVITTQFSSKGEQSLMSSAGGGVTKCRRWKR